MCTVSIYFMYGHFVSSTSLPNSIRFDFEHTSGHYPYVLGCAVYMLVDLLINAFLHTYLLGYVAWLGFFFYVGEYQSAIAQTTGKKKSCKIRFAHKFNVVSKFIIQNLHAFNFVLLTWAAYLNRTYTRICLQTIFDCMIINFVEVILCTSSFTNCHINTEIYMH